MAKRPSAVLIDRSVHDQVAALAQVEFPAIRRAVNAVGDSSITISRFMQIVDTAAGTLKNDQRFPETQPHAPGRDLVEHAARDMQWIGPQHPDYEKARNTLVGAVTAHITGGRDLSTLAEDIAHRAFRATLPTTANAYYEQLRKLTASFAGGTAAGNLTPVVNELQRLRGPIGRDQVHYANPLSKGRRRQGERVISGIKGLFAGLSAPLHVEVTHRPERSQVVAQNSRGISNAAANLVNWSNRAARRILAWDKTPDVATVMHDMHTGKILHAQQGSEIDQDVIDNAILTVGPTRPYSTNAFQPDIPTLTEEVEVLMKRHPRGTRAAVAATAITAAFVGLPFAPARPVESATPIGDDIRNHSTVGGERSRRPPTGPAADLALDQLPADRVAPQRTIGIDLR